MSLSVTKGEGVTVLTMTSDPKSQVPLVLQLLVSLCCGPFCYVSQRLRRVFTGTQTALGIVQIMVGLFNIGLGVIRLSAHHSFLRWISAPYWLGGMFIAAGIICILGERFPSPCLVFLTALMNLATTCLAVTAIVLYSVDLSDVMYLRYTCDSFKITTPEPERYYRYRTATESPEKILARRIAYQQNSATNFEICQSNRNLLLLMMGGIDILLILFAVLQLCVTITAAVFGLKAFCQKRTEGKPEADPELYKPLVEEATTNNTV